MTPTTDALLATLSTRFEANMARHPGLAWAEVAARLAARPGAVEAVLAMENSGGEPDLVVFPGDEWAFVDCVRESPARRSLCYDRAALEARKEHKPAGDAVSAAQALGGELLDEAQYFALQSVGEFDLKTSSWLRTPDSVRKLGGSLFGDRRYNRVFVFHNGADSYYGSRGFRVLVRI